MPELLVGPINVAVTQDAISGAITIHGSTSKTAQGLQATYTLEPVDGGFVLTPIRKVLAQASFTSKELSDALTTGEMLELGPYRMTLRAS